MIKYILLTLFALLISFLSEELLTALDSGSRLSFKSKINLKRLLVLSLINLTVWALLCLFVYRTSLLTAVLLCIAFDILLYIAIEDIKHKKIKNVCLIALLVTAVIVTLTDNALPWYIHILGCAVGYLPMFLIRAVGEAVKKQEVLGTGDAYLSGILGLMLGLYNFLVCGIITSLIALVAVRIIRHKKHYDKMHTFPFSPFFLLGYTLSILFGNLIISQYISFVVGML